LAPTAGKSGDEQFAARKFISLAAAFLTRIKATIMQINRIFSESAPTHLTSELTLPQFGRISDRVALFPVWHLKV